MSAPPNGPPPPYYGYPPPGAPGFAYVPAPVMMPVYPPPPPQPEPVQPPQPTYVTNYIYQQPPVDPVQVVQGPPIDTTTVTTVDNSYHSRPRPLFPALREQLAKTWFEVDQCVSKILTGHETIDWADATPSTAVALSHKAFVAGKEGWDGSPIWVIRAHHSGDFVPGKLAIKSRAAYIPHAGKEVPVHNFEVLLAQPHMVRWLPASNGQVPVGAIPAGNTHSGEPLYIARVQHQRSVTPGKVHPSHGCCYISFGGSEISYKSYEVLCKIVG
ncbi:uncharacterized protein LOC142976643 isoform X1 [Anticarsia gemmatalis]|uniref:uncharacterized protein LOC142976643 isoform X1 n=1 Tax=Anticarsia gemmatalis TaxID=129554 RepID=UPI003F769CC4